MRPCRGAAAAAVAALRRPLQRSWPWIRTAALRRPPRRNWPWSAGAAPPSAAQQAVEGHGPQSRRSGGRIHGTEL